MKKYLILGIIVFVIIIILIITIIIYIKRKKISNFINKRKVKRTLHKLPKDKYCILEDLVFKYKDYTHQIDYLVLSRYGIFVIEMKNFRGKIVGDEYKDNWVNINKKHKHYFYNPLYQNNSHIKVLESLVKLNGDIYKSIICFSNRVDIEVSSHKDIVSINELIHCIRKYKKVVNYYNLDELEKLFLDLNIHHVEDNNVCPKCGGKLVVREGQYGAFYGCSNYPDCKYTKNKT